MIVGFWRDVDFLIDFLQTPLEEKTDKVVEFFFNWISDLPFVFQFCILLVTWRNPVVLYQIINTERNAE